MCVCVGGGGGGGNQCYWETKYKGWPQGAIFIRYCIFGLISLIFICCCQPGVVIDLSGHECMLTQISE